jgi:membrane protease YdiL (CAAX protease family)
MLVGAACLALSEGIRRGQLPDPLPATAAWVPSGLLLGWLAVPFVTLLLLGHDALRWFGPGDVRRVAVALGVSIPLVVFCAWYVARLPAFRAAYPARVPEGRELVGGFLVLLCTEFFFRGFLVLSLFDRLGWTAAASAALPYCLIHAGKPLVELWGSIPFGLGLSWLAVRSGSIVYGLALHWLLAVGIPFWLATRGP